MMRKKTQDMLQALIPNEQKRKVPNDIWARMDASQRIEELTGHSLDNCRDILDLPIEVAVKSPTVMNGKVGIIRAILQVVARVGIESSRGRALQQQPTGNSGRLKGQPRREAPGRGCLLGKASQVQSIIASRIPMEMPRT